MSLPSRCRRRLSTWAHAWPSMLPCQVCTSAPAADCPRLFLHGVYARHIPVPSTPPLHSLHCQLALLLLCQQLAIGKLGFVLRRLCMTVRQLRSAVQQAANPASIAPPVLSILIPVTQCLYSSSSLSSPLAQACCASHGMRDSLKQTASPLHAGAQQPAAPLTFPAHGSGPPQDDLLYNRCLCITPCCPHVWPMPALQLPHPGSSQTDPAGGQRRPVGCGGPPVGG